MDSNKIAETICKYIDNTALMKRCVNKIKYTEHLKGTNNHKIIGMPLSIAKEYEELGIIDIGEQYEICVETLYDTNITTECIDCTIFINDGKISSLVRKILTNGEIKLKDNNNEDIKGEIIMDSQSQSETKIYGLEILDLWAGLFTDQELEKYQVKYEEILNANEDYLVFQQFLEVLKNSKNDKIRHRVQHWKGISDSLGITLDEILTTKDIEEKNKAYELFEKARSEADTKQSIVLSFLKSCRHYEQAIDVLQKYNIIDDSLQMVLEPWYK